jgi:catechol 2,3-dioxygenase-like lactoylglutathione lyase family enzyme
MAETVTATPAPVIGSMLLASTNPDRLRTWYEQAFNVQADADGFLQFGGVDLLIDGRDDVTDTNPQPARVIINLHVHDAHATAKHLDSLGVTWLAELEYRAQHGLWFATVIDPDGNYVQIIEATPAYRAAKRSRTGQAILQTSPAGTRLPAQDLDRARRFYADKLGLHPIEERPGGLRYECGGATFSLFASGGRPSGEHTQMAWTVDDIETTVEYLRSRGVVFEDVDLPGLRTTSGIADVTGNYPSTGATGERAAWFRDSEGNLLGIGQPHSAEPAAPASE